MDGGLAQVMAATGFDPLTGTMTNPPDAPTDAAFEAPPLAAQGPSDDGAEAAHAQASCSG
jgi:hypothetical protein